MGEEPEEYEPGNNCDVCWGPGKAFGDYPTPKHVHITWAGLVGDCAAGNQTYTATQSDIWPCIFLFDDGTFYGTWQAGPGAASCTLARRDPDVACANLAGAICATHFEQGVVTADVT